MFKDQEQFNHEYHFLKKQLKTDACAAVKGPIDPNLTLPAGVTIDELIANPNKAAMVLLPEVG